MPRALVTAFEPFGRWNENSSRLCLNVLQQAPPEGFDVTTAVYPVDFERAWRRLQDDLRNQYDVALHLGQAAISADVRLELVARNARETSEGLRTPLLDGGPAMYRSTWPLENWASQLTRRGVPASVSCDAGAYLCNATLYWSRHYAVLWNLPTRQTFLHLPLAPSQATGMDINANTLAPELTAEAARWMLETLAQA